MGVWGYFVLWSRFGGKLSPMDELAAAALPAAAGMEVAPVGCGDLPLRSLIPSTSQPHGPCPVWGEEPKGGTAAAPGHSKAQLLPPRLPFRAPFAKESLETSPGNTQLSQNAGLAAQRGRWAGSRHGRAHGQGLDRSPGCQPHHPGSPPWVPSYFPTLLPGLRRVKEGDGGMTQRQMHK